MKIENNTNLNKEFKELKKEEDSLLAERESYRSQLIDSLIKGGMGVEIKQTLSQSNQKKMSKFKLKRLTFKNKVNNLIEKIIDVL